MHLESSRGNLASSKVTVSVFASSCKFWKGGLMLALWAGSAPKWASGSADSLPGKSQLLCLGLVSCPRQTASAEMLEEEGSSRLVVEISTTAKTCFGALLMLALLLLLLFHSFLGSHLQPQAHRTHIETKPFSERVQLCCFICLKTFEFPVSVGAAWNLLWLFF